MFDSELKETVNRHLEGGNYRERVEDYWNDFPKNSDQLAEAIVEDGKEDGYLDWNISLTLSSVSLAAIPLLSSGTFMMYGEPEAAEVAAGIFQASALPVAAESYVFGKAGLKALDEYNEIEDTQD